LLVRNGLSVDEICVLSYYYAQIQRIRRHLREKKLGRVSILYTCRNCLTLFLDVICTIHSLLQIEVHGIENVQGREFRALLISTVRTCSSEPLPEEDAAFLTNAKVGGVNHAYIKFDGVF
jgi:superfamily I DNA and/or RNA helicase